VFLSDDGIVYVYWRGRIFDFACVLLRVYAAICGCRFAGWSVYSIHPKVSWFELFWI